MAEPTVSSPEITFHRPLPAAVIRGTDIPVGEMIRFLDDAFSALRAAIDAAAVAPIDPLYARYDTELEGNVTVEAGVPLLAPITEPLEFNDIEIVAGEVPGGRVARAVHYGPYRELAETWQTFLGAVEGAGHRPRKPYFESYTTTPATADDRDALTTELIAHLEETE